MSQSHTTPVHEDTLRVPGATLHYEVRGTGPLMALIGSPMGTGPFRALADLLARDHTVLTADPRGIGRSRLDDPTAVLHPGEARHPRRSHRADVRPRSSPQGHRR